MAKQEEEKKGKKGIKAIVIAILVPILILIIVISAVMAIFDGLVDLFMQLVGKFLRALIELFKNPVEWVKLRWAEFSTWLEHKGLRRWNI